MVCLLSEFAMAPRSFRSVGRYCIVAPGEVGHNSPEDRAALARGCPVRDRTSSNAQPKRQGTVRSDSRFEPRNVKRPIRYRSVSISMGIEMSRCEVAQYR